MSETPERLPLPTADRWREIERLFDAALERRVEERPAFLERACGDDRLLRAELEALLEAETRSSTTEIAPLLAAAERFAALWNERDDDESFREEIAGEYALHEELGHGAMAIVYRATRRADGVEVALKAIRYSASAQGAARFRREIAIVGGVQHPHIVPVLDCGECRGRLWFTMPLAPGASLGAWLRQHGRMPLRSALPLLREITDALAFAHARGIVHRDLKPENILLAHAGAGAMIADFGVAKAVADCTLGVPADVTADAAVRTGTGVGLGTLTYMAPEQAVHARDVDRRADLYSLGVVAYELLTGTPPFVADTRQALLTAHLTRQPAALSSRVRDDAGDRLDDIPESLNTLILRCLAKQPADRPQTADEIAAGLARVAADLDGRGAAAPGPWRRLTRRLGLT